jgi:lysylphosphatidylglycerol synthetase-like protein (DUF2156 family)/UDP-2,3-diacylglucosamine pyrophosphatase LpxH
MFASVRAKNWTKQQMPPNNLVTIEIDAGERVIVTSDLHLGPHQSDAAAFASARLADVLNEWAGPGAVVLNGDVIELLGIEQRQIADTLRQHRRLIALLRDFADGDDHRLVYVIGDHDAQLAWDEPLGQRIRDELHCEFALACDLVFETGAGRRTVRVEHGQRFDPANAFTNISDPLDTPLGHHIADEIVPALNAARRPWLAGMDALADPASLPGFIASRLAYRRVFRPMKWLVLPFLLALLVRLPVVHRPPRFVGWSLIASGVGAAGLLLLGVALAIAARQVREAISAVHVQTEDDPNAEPRDEARKLIREGFAGFITGHTHRPEFAPLGDGFYVNSGCSARVVRSYEGRSRLPDVFVTHREVCWVELEAGATLHARLEHARQDEPGETLLERFAAKIPRTPTEPAEVATFPGKDPWPPQRDVFGETRRVRTRAALAVLLTGVVNLASASTPPLRARLDDLRQILPVTVPETAAALTALAGVGLILLARGMRRGQRRAWIISIGLLGVSVLLHVVKGLDIEEASFGIVVLAYVGLHPSAFKIKTEPRRIRAIFATLATTVAVAFVSGVVAVELPRTKPSLPNALLAVAERFVAVSNVRVAHRVNMFLTPVLTAITFGVVVAVGWSLFRPLASRRIAGSSDRRRARQIVKTYGTDTLAYFALRDDKQYFFRGESLVAYAVLGGVCLVSPDPIGPAWERDSIWRSFRDFANENGWALAVIGADAEWLPTYRASGMHDLYLGDEAIVDCRHFSLEGGKFKNLRQQIANIRRLGYSTHVGRVSSLDANTREQIIELAGRLIRGGTERGFSMTLGRLVDPQDEDILVAVAFDADRKPVAFCQFVPAPGIDGYSLDVMRRAPGQLPNSIVDFVVVAVIDHLKERGLRGLGLNFATFRAVVAGETGSSVRQRTERWLLSWLSASMQIESLWQYNEKYDPEWHPRYGVYDAVQNIVPIAVAVMRAEQFTEFPLLGRFLKPPAAVSGS